MDKKKLFAAMQKSAMVGALTDGAIAVLEKKGPSGVVNDMACGTVTGATGAAAAMVYKDKINEKGIGSLLVGSVVSVATRYGYRGLFGPKQNDEEE